MSDLLISVMAFAVGLAAAAWTIWAWRWQADRADHRLARWYHHNYRLADWPYKNGAALAPVAVGWAFLIGVAHLLGGVAPRLGESLTWVGVLLGFPLLVLTFWALLRPASWMQPPWLVEARRREEAGLPSNVPTPPEGNRPVMTRRALALTIVGYAFFAAAWWYFGLPLQHLLFGLAAGIPILLATRIKK